MQYQNVGYHFYLICHSSTDQLPYCCKLISAGLQERKHQSLLTSNWIDDDFLFLQDNSTDECYFMCGDGTCLESDDVCNGHNDCSDFSDEDLCRKFSKETS